MNTLKTIATLFALMLSLPTSAGPIDVTQARTLVLQQHIGRTMHSVAAKGQHKASSEAPDLQHVYTRQTATGRPAVYVFNSSEGFVLAAADDAVPTILGYSDSGTFDPDNIPDGLQSLMDNYARQIAALPASRAAADLGYEVESTAPVRPLLETQWDQQEPFNRECPLAFTVGANSNAATGCMTTAIAQIMRYHKWPETTGFGSCEMEAKQGLTTVHVERYYYNTSYNWDIMPLKKNNFTQSGANEVSKLMMDVAVGLRTEFGGSSNAVHIAIVPMLLSFFNYDPGIEVVELKNMSTEAFNSIVIADLQAGRPVYFQGTPSSGGHAFVCDGYDGAGLFHINWGWSGTADGHFRITNLSPSEAGTGGVANAGYSEGLLMVHNIKPFRNGTLARPEIRATYSREVQPGITLTRTNSGYRFGGNFIAYPAAPQYRNIRAKMGLCIEKPDGTRIERWRQSYTQILRNNFDNTFAIDLEPSLLTDGTTVSYIYRENENEPWLYVKNTRGDRCAFSIETNSRGDLVAKTGYQAYTLEEAGAGSSANTVAITYNINLNGQSIGQTTVTDRVGETPSRDFIPEHYVQASGFPDRVPATPTTYTIDTYYKDNMPFSPDGSTTYNLSFCVDGNTYTWYVANNTALEMKNPDRSAGNNSNAKWRFAGNWFEGFSIQNASGNQYITTPVDPDNEERVIPNASTSYSVRQKYLLLHRDEGYYFKVRNSENELYLAHIQPQKLEISLFNQKYYAGNIVAITSPGSLPLATGVDYTVSFSGQPMGETPRLTFGQNSYGEGDHFRAVDLAKSQLSATGFDGLDCDITVGASTVYVTYTPGSLNYVTYTVNITGEYPAGQQPVLIYNNQSYRNGERLTASNLTLMQLSASEYADYSCTIAINSSTITVTYTGINYKTYTVRFTGLPADRSPELFYNSRAVRGTTFRAGDLTLGQLSATSYSDYGHKITIGNDDVITVTYYGGEFFFDFTRGNANARNNLEQLPVTVSYQQHGYINNIYREGNYTRVTSSEAPIEKIEFIGFSDFDEIRADTGNLNTTTGVWTHSDGTQSVKFTGGDGYATGMRVYLRLPEVSAVEHDIVDDVCTTCGHGFFAYTASSKVTPHAAEALLDEEGNVLHIVNHTFEGGEGLIEFNAPLATIGAEAFASCTDLTGTLTIPRHTRTIGSRAFAGCNRLSVVEFTTIPQVGSAAFDGVTADVRLALDDQSHVSTAASNHFPDVDAATYSRQMANEWGTIVVPFSIDASNGDYELYGLSQVRNDELVLTRLTGTVDAGTPALILMDESTLSHDKYVLSLHAVTPQVNTAGSLTAATVEGLTLKGSYQVTDITDEHGFIISRNKFWNIQTSRGTNSVYNAPFRAYISAASPVQIAQLNLAIGGTDEPTDLDTLEALTNGSAAYYSPSGQRITRLQPGVNIVRHTDGKTTKIIIK